jgi:hypothetical protein
VGVVGQCWNNISSEPRLDFSFQPELEMVTWQGADDGLVFRLRMVPLQTPTPPKSMGVLGHNRNIMLTITPPCSLDVNVVDR